MGRPPRLVYVVNPAIFFVSHRMALAEMAKSRGYDVHVITPQGLGTDFIRASGFEWHPIRFDPGGMNPVRDMATIVDLVRLFRRLKPSVVHNVTLKPVLYGTFAARCAGVKRVVNAISGLGYMFTANRPFARFAGILLYRLFMRHRGMRVIVQNAEDMALFRGLRLASPEALVLIRGSGVDLSRFAPRRKAQSPPTILQVSRMVGDKGVREFIAAAAKVHIGHPHARFVLVGPLYPGNPSALAEAELRGAERAGHIRWLGPREDIEEVLAEATIFCLPSYREGLPKALLEAGACGLPAVTTATSGCKEVIRDGINGLLVPVGDAAALAAAITRLLEDPAGAAAMGRRAREIVENEFALEQVLSAQLALYRE